MTPTTKKVHKAVSLLHQRQYINSHAMPSSNTIYWSSAPQPCKIIVHILNIDKNELAKFAPQDRDNNKSGVGGRGAEGGTNKDEK